MNLTKTMPVITQDQVDQAAMGVAVMNQMDQAAMGVAVMNQMDQAAMGVMIRMKNRRTVDHGQQLILFQLFLYHL
jgi:hypothetical protein